MAEYTPTTEEVRAAWAHTGWGRQYGDVPLLVFAAEFDRWLAAHDAEVAAKALDASATAALSGEDCIPWDRDEDRATVSIWLEDRAAALRKEATS